MSLQPALPSSGRSRLALAAALLVVMALAAGGALLWRPLTALAHHNDYSADGTCAGWTATGKYVGGDTEVLIVLENVVVGGNPYDSSWKSAVTFTKIPSYGGEDIAGKPFQSSPPQTGATLWYWKGKSNGFTIFARNGSWSAGIFGGRILLYRDDKTDGDWDLWDSDDIKAPGKPSKCEFKVCKIVDDNYDGDTDGGTFPFEITINGQPQSFNLTDNSEGRSSKDCKTFKVDPGSTATVTELTGRPPGWLGDASGYPKYQIGSGSPQSGSTASLSFSGNDTTITVTFRNKEHPSRTLTVCKEVEPDGFDPNNESWAFTFTVSWDNTQVQLSVTDTEGGSSTCSQQIEVPRDVDVTVAENGRPANWDGDASGYPKWQIERGASGTGGTADVPSNKNKITFTNKEATIATCADLGYELLVKFEWNGGWSPEGGNSMGVSLSGNAQSGTWSSSTWPITALIIKGGQNIVPHTGAPYIAENGMSGAYDNQGLVGPKGQSQDISNIQFCYAGKRTVRVIKVIEGTSFPQAPFSFGGDVGSQDWTVTFNTASDGASQSTDLQVPTTALVVTEDDPGPSWSLAGFAVLSGLQGSCANAGYSGTSATVPAGNQNYTVCVKNTPATRTVEICKIVEDNDDGNNDSGDFKFELIVGETQSETVTIPATEGGTGEHCATRSVPADASVEVIELSDRPGKWTTDASGYPMYKIGHGDWSEGSKANLGTSGTKVTFKNKDSRSQTVTFIKVICPTYGDVPANANPTTYDQTGGHAGELNTTYQTGKTNPSTDIPQNCQRAPGWSFDLWQTGSSNDGNPIGVNKIRTVGPTDGNGEVTVQLTPDEIDEVLSGDGLWVSEVTQSGFGFAALRCYDDILHGDNLEYIKLSSVPTEGVYCIAYNVELKGTLIVKKVVTNVEDDDTKFDVTVTPSGGGASQTGTIVETDADGTPFRVEAGTYTVTEDVPSGYNFLGWRLAGEQGECPAGNPQNADAEVQVPAGDTAVVCLYNEKHGTVTVEKTNDTNGTATPGGSFTWTITVTVSDGPLGQDVVVSDPLPNGSLTYGTITPATEFTSCDLTPPDISCTLQAGTPAGSYTITIPVTVAESFGACRNFENIAVLTAGQSELGRASDTVAVQCVAGSGTIIVKKVVPGAGIDTTTFTAVISPVPGGTTFSEAMPAVVTGLNAGAYTVTEQLPAGWQFIGHAVLQGEGGCPGSPASNLMTANVTVSVDQPIWTVCFYNEPREEPQTGNIYIRKVVVDQSNQVVSDPATFFADIAGFALDRPFSQVSAHVASGVPYGTYTVSEDPKAGYTYVGFRVLPGNRSCQASVAGVAGGNASVTLSAEQPDWTVCFYNRTEVRETPTPPPTPRTPVVPKTPTPSPTPTETPTPTPTQVVESPTPTPTETVAGEATPGPSPTATPRVGGFGSGTAAPSGGAFSALALLGLAVMTAGAAIFVLGRRKA